VIVVGVREPCAAPRESREPAPQLWAEPVEVVIAELIDRDENDQRGRLEVGIAGRGRLTTGTSRETNDEEKRSEESDHSHLSSETVEAIRA
jgi:hypothetical protein